MGRVTRWRSPRRRAGDVNFMRVRRGFILIDFGHGPWKRLERIIRLKYDR